MQLGIGENRDTLYSLGVFDLTEPVTITKPETSGRYQSMLVQNEDQYLELSTTRPGKYTITRQQAGTRYVGVNFRTFVDPNDPVDVRTVHHLQDEIVVEQASAGSFEIPDWDGESYRRVDAAFSTLYYTMDDWSNAFGDVDQVDPVKFYVASASGWTGVPEPFEASTQRLAMKFLAPRRTDRVPAPASGQTGERRRGVLVPPPDRLDEVRQVVVGSADAHGEQGDAGIDEGGGVLGASPRHGPLDLVR